MSLIGFLAVNFFICQSKKIGKKVYVEVYTGLDLI